jgi:hypothetical protein
MYIAFRAQLTIVFAWAMICLSGFKAKVPDIASKVLTSKPYQTGAAHKPRRLSVQTALTGSTK